MRTVLAVAAILFVARCFAIENVAILPAEGGGYAATCQLPGPSGQATLVKTFTQTTRDAAVNDLARILRELRYPWAAIDRAFRHVWDDQDDVWTRWDRRGTTYREVF